MKGVFLTVFFVGFCGVLADVDDAVWSQLMHIQIAESLDDKADESNKTIPALAADLGLNTLVELVKKANLADALSGEGPFTVFGPTDKAFRKLPKKLVDFLLKNVTVLAKILEYHVASGKVMSGDLKDNMLVTSLQGKDIRVNIYKNGTVITASGRPVTLADQVASNGVIHEVGGVLFPPPGTVTSVVTKCPIFSTLATAVTKAGLGPTLDGAGPFTVFAPCDKAFHRLSPKCLDALLQNKTLLTSVLEYHVVPAVAYSAGLSCGDCLKTVQGGDVHITKMFGRIRVNHARVVYPDATTTNGVMHVIDRLLWPRDMPDDFCDDSNQDYDDNEDINVEVPPFF